jgi:hypothetical protein
MISAAELTMPTYVANIHLKGIAPVCRYLRLDELMESLGFCPWRPSVPVKDPDEENGFSQWEYAANHPLDAEPLKAMLEERIGTEIQGDIDVTVSRVRIKGE